jgi:hypothetical protein
MVSFCRKDLTQPLEEAEAKVDLIINQATEADIDQLAALVGKRYGPRARQWFTTQSIPETIHDRFEHGARCFVGKVGTEMVAYNWIFFHTKEWPREPYFVHLSDQEALCDEAFTVEEWRGKRIHGAVHNRMLLFLQQSGFRMAYTLVGTDQVSSKKALYALGWDFYGTLLYFSPHRSDRVLRWQVRGPLDPFVAKETKSEEHGKS